MAGLVAAVLFVAMIVTVVTNNEDPVQAPMVARQVAVGRATAKTQVDAKLEQGSEAHRIESADAIRRREALRSQKKAGGTLDSDFQNVRGLNLENLP